MIRNLSSIAAATFLCSGPALAEPDYAGFVEALFLIGLSGLAYLLLGILLIVLAFRREWRRLGWIAGAGGLLCLVFPIADIALLQWQRSSLRAAEIRQAPPDYTSGAVLLITSNEDCYYLLCPALLRLRQGEAIWRLDPSLLAPPGEALELSIVPLTRITSHPENHHMIEFHYDTTLPERPVFDTVIYYEAPSYLSKPGQIEAGLPQMPGGLLLGRSAVVHALAAPIVDSRLDVASLDPDYLIFYLNRKARRVPLFPFHTKTGEPRDYEWNSARLGWFCGAPSNTQAEGYANCLNELR